MQKCIDAADVEQREMLISNIVENTDKFVRNPYGNYVVSIFLHSVAFINRIESDKLGLICAK